MGSDKLKIKGKDKLAHIRDMQYSLWFIAAFIPLDTAASSESDMQLSYAALI